MKAIDGFEKWALVILMVVMTLVVIYQITNRFLIKSSMPWSEEMARYLFAWLVFLGSSYAAKQKAHIGVTALVNMLPGKTQRIAEIVMYLICMGLSIVLVIFGAQIMIVQKSMNQLSPVMRIPMYWPYLSIPFGGVFIFTRFTQHFLNAIKLVRIVG